MKTSKIDSISRYLSLPYTTILRRDEQGDVIARIEELPGCVSHGRHAAEALRNIESMQRLWLEDAIAAGEKIPEPGQAEHLPSSGKWLQRVPRSLHHRLTKMARQEGVSLNQLVLEILAERCGSRAAEDRLGRVPARNPRVALAWRSVCSS